MSRQMILKIGLSVAGGIGGWLYYHYIGCNAGCAIWSSPFISTGYGALIGFLIAGLFTLRDKKDKTDEPGVDMENS